MAVCISSDHTPSSKLFNIAMIAMIRAHSWIINSSRCASRKLHLEPFLPVTLPYAHDVPKPPRPMNGIEYKQPTYLVFYHLCPSTS